MCSQPTVQRAIELPQQDALDSNLRIAIFDGGLPETSPLTVWTNPLEVQGIGESDPELLLHGETVTSALLFGSVAGIRRSVSVQS